MALELASDSASGDILRCAGRPRNRITSRSSKEAPRRALINNLAVNTTFVAGVTRKARDAACLWS